MLMTNMNVEEFKTKIQKKIFWVWVLIMDLWLEQQLHQKQSILQITKLTTLFIKEFWWEKNWDDVNWLSTFKKLSQFESCENFKIFKIKIYWIKF
jgi:hypothetical protein